MSKIKRHVQWPNLPGEMSEVSQTHQALDASSPCEDKKAILRETVARLITLFFVKQISSLDKFISQSVVSHLPRQFIGLYSRRLQMYVITSMVLNRVFSGLPVQELCNFK